MTGLPPRGRCPECGADYDARFGGGPAGERAERHNRGDRLMRRLRTIGLVVLAVMVFGCGGLFALGAREPATPLWTGALFAGLCLLGAFTSYLYEREG